MLIPTPKQLILFILTAACFLGTNATAGLKIYYIRHAEGGHNVAKYWENVLEHNWPDYVGNPNTFSPQGIEERDRRHSGTVCWFREEHLAGRAWK